MKKLFVILLLLCTVTAGAQQHIYQLNLYTEKARNTYYNWRKNDRDSILRHNITGSISYKKSYSKNGILVRSVVKRELKYDYRGDLVSEINYNDEGKPLRHFEHTYNDSGLETGFKAYDSKRVFKNGWQFMVNDAGLPEKRVHYWKEEQKVAWTEAFAYDSKGNIIKITYYDSKDRVTGAVEYEYYAEGNTKEIRTYNKKRKLKTVLKYDCLPTGTLSNGRKADTTTVCMKSTYDADSNRIETREEIKQNGKIWRYISKINKKGQTIEVSSINYKGRQGYKINYTYAATGKIASYSMSMPHRKKYFTYKEEYDYLPDNKGKITKHFNRDSQLVFEWYEVLR